jgi:hypothetical protein
MACNLCNQEVQILERCELEPCGCLLCLHCMIEAHCDRRLIEAFKYPCCQVPVSGHRWHRKRFIDAMPTRRNPNHHPIETVKEEFVEISNDETPLNPIAEEATLLKSERECLILI